MPKKPIERTVRYDEQTGTRVIQLTTFPLIHYHQYCYGQWITSDAETTLFFGYRDRTRDSAVDLWRVDRDGSDIVKVADGAGWSAISPDGRTVYFGRGGSIWRVPLKEPGAEEELFRDPDASGMLVSAVSTDGRYVFAQGQYPPGTGDDGRGFQVIRLDLADGRSEAVCRTKRLMHLQLHPMPDGAPRLLANIQPPGEDLGIWTFSFDGDDFLPVRFPRTTNHFASLGPTNRIVCTAYHPGKAIDVTAPGDAEPSVLAEGVGFWHPTCDASGEWVAADTNWPDVGLQLVHAPTGRYRTLCYPGASGGGPQWTHAHPRLAPDASYVVFDSDRTGICHVYLADITDEIRNELRRTP